MNFSKKSCQNVIIIIIIIPLFTGVHP